MRARAWQEVNDVEDKERKVFHRDVIRLLLILFGLLIVYGYLSFTVSAIHDYSRDDLSSYLPARWRSVIFACFLFFARVILFCLAARMDDGGKIYKVGTRILQGFYAELGILMIVLLALITNGWYHSETIQHFCEFMEILAFLAISQGMIQRIAHNVFGMIRLLMRDKYGAFEPYILRIIFYAIILYKNHEIGSHWFFAWLRMFPKMIGR